MDKFEQSAQELYEGFYIENPDFEIIRPYVVDDVKISISLLFFGNAYLYIVRILSKLTVDKDKDVSRIAKVYLQNILNYIASFNDRQNDLAEDILNEFSYSLYKVSDEYNRVLSYAPKSIQAEVKIINKYYDKPDDDEIQPKHQTLMDVVEKLVRDKAVENKSD